MTQNILPIKFEQEPSSRSVTAYAGLPLYLELSEAIGLRSYIDRTVNQRKNGQGWTDNQVIQSLLLLNLAGGSCVDDIRVLEDDPGLNRIIKHCQFSSGSRVERRQGWTRFRRGTRRAFPSPSSIRRYLASFHDPKQDCHRKQGTAYIPTPTAGLRALEQLNAWLVGELQAQSPEPSATLDIDATLIESHAQDALFCYKGFRSWQPVNVYWAEQDVVVHSEFRDGNVPAGFALKPVLEKSLNFLPAGVRQINVRSDSAGYDHEFLRFMATEQKRSGRAITFTVSVDVTPAFKKAVSDGLGTWNDFYKMVGGERRPTGQQWAEVCFVPNKLAQSKKDPEYRYIAIREALTDQLSLPEAAPQQLSLPFPTMEMEDEQGKRKYKITGIVTNYDTSVPGDQIIRFHHKRSGKSEQANGILKNDLAGGPMPSKLFGANAAWWAIVVMAHNLNTLMKRCALGERWFCRHLKAIRFELINRAGTVIERARIVRIRVSESMLRLITTIRERIKGIGSTPLLPVES